MEKIVVYLLIVFFLRQNSYAQQLQLTNYTSQQGAPVYGANSIFQDSHGWIWFTSGYEVIRYDGHRFITYPVSAGAKMDFCFRLFEVRGEIWVIAAPDLLKVSGDSLYKLDVGNQNPGILDHKQHQGNSYFLCVNGIYQLKQKQLEPIITDLFLAIIGSESMEVFNDSLFVSHKFGKSLLVFNSKRKEYKSLPLPVTDMVKDENGRIVMMIKGKGLVQLNKISAGNNVLEIETEPVTDFIDPANEHFVMDGLGNFWSYHQFRELIRVSGNSRKVFNESHGLPSIWFNYLFVDREKNLWIGFNSGLCKIGNKSWERYTIGELYANHILFFAAGPGKGQTFIGTQNGLNFFDNGQMKKLQNGKQPFRCHNLIASGTTLYYHLDSALYSAQIDTGSLTIKAITKLADLPGRAQQFILYKGRIIIATSHGIYWYANGNLTRIGTDTIHFKTVFIDSRDRLWAGKFAYGLQCYRINDNGPESTFRKIMEIESISAAAPPLLGIRALAEDRKGNILAGTRYNGLFMLTLRQDTIIHSKHFSEKEGLSNSIWSITINKGDTWIATAKGLNRLTYHKDAWEVIDEGKERQLYQAGIVFSEDNNIWVASHPGAVLIRNNADSNVQPFSVILTGFMVNGKSIKPQDMGTSRLTDRQNNVSIQFTSNTYRDENGVLYSWKLNDDDEWTIPAPLHSVNYSALRPGKYNFRVKALSSDGRWSKNETGVSFQILPPFWKRPWFIVLILLALFSGGYLLYRYRVRRLKDLYEMRNIIARDLHDEIGSTLTSINILSKVSQRHLKKDDKKAGELLQKVIDQSQQIQQNMSDIVWAIRPDNDRMENMTARMREYLSHTLEPKNIAIDFTADEKIMQENLTMQQRRDFFLIFKEAVNNIAKYSQCMQTHVKLTRQNGNISLTIQDDGIGFDMTTLYSTGGLENMKRRTELLKGSINIQSAPGKGTTVELLVPATS